MTALERAAGFALVAVAAGAVAVAALAGAPPVGRLPDGPMQTVERSARSTAPAGYRAWERA